MVIIHPPKEEEFTIHVRAIIEVMSTKQEMTTKALEEYITTLKDPSRHPDVRVTRYALADPNPQEDGTFTNFTEIELRFARVESLIGYCFDALPSSIEIIEPTELHFESRELTGLLNDLQSRLHKVNFELGKLQGNYKLLEENSVALLRNFLIHILRQKPVHPHDVARALGLSEKALAALIARYIKPGIIELRDNMYYLVN